MIPVFTLFLSLFNTILPHHLEAYSENRAFSDRTFVIVANGEIDINLLREQPSSSVMIALDGAANCFYKEGLVPDFILGDMDSIEEKTALHFKELEVSFLFREDQEHTDLEKGILFCDQMKAHRIIILGALNGERTDHLFGNLSCLKKYHSSTRALSIHTSKEIIEFLKDQEVCIHAETGSKFGLIGFSEAIAYSHGEGKISGLQWELDAFPLKLGVTESVCNIVVSPRVWIRIEGEALMIRQRFH